MSERNIILAETISQTVCCFFVCVSAVIICLRMSSCIPEEAKRARQTTEMLVETNTVVREFCRESTRRVEQALADCREPKEPS